MSRADEVLMAVNEGTRGNKAQKGVHLTIRDLIKATKDFRAKQKVVGKVEFISSKPFRRNKQVIFRFETRAKTRGKAKYRESIIFHKVSFSDEQGTEHPFGVDLGFGEVFYMERLSAHKHPVSVDCSCKDYYFTWWYHNFHNHKVQLGGRKRPYVRVKPPSGLPRRNPDEIPGLCKHLISCVNYLKRQKVLGG